jgi:hypothetical protein
LLVHVRFANKENILFDFKTTPASRRRYIYSSL